MGYCCPGFSSATVYIKYIKLYKVMKITNRSRCRHKPQHELCIVTKSDVLKGTTLITLEHKKLTTADALFLMSQACWVDTVELQNWPDWKSFSNSIQWNQLGAGPVGMHLEKALMKVPIKIRHVLNNVFPGLIWVLAFRFTHSVHPKLPSTRFYFSSCMRQKV